MSERGLIAQKEAVLSRYGVERIRDLSEKQLDHLIDGLRAMPEIHRREAAPDIRKARSVVLNLLDDLGIKAKNGNWKPVNDYLMQPRIAGKVLYDMTADELKDCAKRLRVVIKKRRAENEDLARQALEN
ncbi:MAG: hypothetical protein EPGJADBJ_04449 [Saprospiraceae bacterium]|nr:hypothetical protein [Saprospiraceae bacterium]